MDKVRKWLAGNEEDDVSSPGTPASSTTKTGRHDMAEIFLKVVLKHQNQIKSNGNCTYRLVAPTAKTSSADIFPLCPLSFIKCSLHPL
jgi:hypothetical protein